MNAFCFVRLWILDTTTSPCTSLMRRKTSWLTLPLSRRIKTTSNSLTELLQLKADGLIPIVASEGHDGNLAPLDEYLLKSKPFCSSHCYPTAVNRYKDLLGARHKTDDYDAYVIADFLRTQHVKIPVHQHQKNSAEFKNLSRTYKAFSQDQNPVH